ncbi:hypothetical protein GPECTOR_6g560 [Gonium pectorale]|uniref:Cleavage/polyadenylation specificity factor A subunit N-terminal domain-containing protein n=1 Tax=Gonium pectorale TaxID=33097 RepID=A0A150GV63_GONPE|nr:hypothetical protein GPECTOR_6g560 [Gonium pectorale]|eukprot:KXZ53643.1 hypothetical protein GPECTOR_6g560 [Gonium pectorale]
MVSPECSIRIRLPGIPGIVLDLQLSPAPAGPSRLAAVAAFGSGLCLVSPQSDTVVATFGGLQYRPYSCSWLPSASATPQAAHAASRPATATSAGEHLLVAGLEKGHLALLDIRRTDRPVALASVLPRQCGLLPVRTVAALPPDVAATTATTGAGGVCWPSVALCCNKGAWLLPGGATAEGNPGVDSAVPNLLPLDGGYGAGSMQIESLAVHCAGAGGEGAGIGRIALSWRPGDGPLGGGAGPRHEIGLLGADPRTPYKHEVGQTRMSLT